jgi:hypothetical protein
MERGKREIPRDNSGAADTLTGLLRPYGLAVRTPPFHGGSPGSIPGRVANNFFSPIKNPAGIRLRPGVQIQNIGPGGPVSAGRQKALMTFMASAVSAVIFGQAFSATSLRSAIHEPPIAATCGTAR